MTDIKLISKDTDLSKLQKPLDWDLVVNGKPYYAVRIDGYVHTIGGKWGDNDIWAYPRDEKPTYQNLIEFNGNDPVCWGITYEPYNYSRCKWDECEIFRTSNLSITRNGLKFCNVRGGINRALVMIDEFNTHPLGFNTIDFDQKMIGQKVWWRSEPAIIESYIDGQACVILAPDGIEKFTVPAEFADEGDDYYEESTVKTSVLDKHIWWFRD